MYEIFAKLLEEHHLTPYQVYKATGVAQSSLSDWKHGKSKPKIDKMMKIADFFGVSLEYLTTGKETEKPTEFVPDDTMLETILDLMGPKKGSGKELADYLGVSGNVITNWKNGSSKSYYRYGKQIAKFYGVSLEYLTTGKEPGKQKAPVPETDTRSVEEILEQAREQLMNQEGLMFDGGVATDEAIESILAAMKIGLELAKTKTQAEKERAAREKAEILAEAEAMED